MLRRALFIAAAMAVSAPAFAAEFFIVRGADKKCTVVEKKPVDKTIVVIGDHAYVSRAEAEKQLKVVCKN